MKDAACAGMAPKDGEPDIFFPERGEPQTPGKMVCITCPVRKDCTDYRDRTGSNQGMWGAVILKEDDYK